MAERDVRFVQIFHRGWDHHGELPKNIRRQTGELDRPADRFKRDLTILPGINEFSMPLADIRHAPADREMNMAAIARLNLYIVKSRDHLELELVELRLQ